MAITLSTANTMLRDGLVKAFRAEYKREILAAYPMYGEPTKPSDIKLVLANGEPQDVPTSEFSLRDHPVSDKQILVWGESLVDSV